MLPFEPTPELLFFVAAVYIGTGIVKGTIGMGLPLITLPLLAPAVGPITAMALLTLPAILTNLWQAVQSGHFTMALRRFWVCYLFAVIGICIGVTFLTRLPRDAVTVILGSIVVIAALNQLYPLRVTVSPELERKLMAPLGLISGLLGGLSMMFGPLVALYLVMIRLTKDEFVGVIGLFYFLSAVPFTIGLMIGGRYGMPELVGSAGATILVIIGMLLGQVVRRFVPQEAFRKTILILLILIGLNVIRKGLM